MWIYVDLCGFMRVAERFLVERGQVRDSASGVHTITDLDSGALTPALSPALSPSEGARERHRQEAQEVMGNGVLGKG